MDIVEMLLNAQFLWQPLTFAVLAAVAVAFVWLAFMPAPAKKQIDQRLEGYADKADVIEEMEMQRSIWKRIIGPALRKTLRLLSRLTPQRNIETTQRLLTYAGEPGQMSVADFLGLQVLCAVLFGGGTFLIHYFVLWNSQTLLVMLRNIAIFTLLGFFLPRLWLRGRVKRRQKEIVQTLSDALDILSVGVEAGLAFESALLKVCERWQNALTEEFHRTVVEMRMGTPRNRALQRMADRTGVQELETFVAVLIQSSELGASIAQVLHTQAAQMRLKRRQRSEELARQAGVKMVFALVFLIFPALLIVLLGPGLPLLFQALSNIGG